jgi:hypothetical protein
MNLWPTAVGALVGKPPEFAMIEVIYVEPLAEGWAVRHDSVENPQVFASGAKAEAAARSLGARLSSAGTAAEIRVVLRDGTLAGRFACSP